MTSPDGTGAAAYQTSKRRGHTLTTRLPLLTPAGMDTHNSPRRTNSLGVNGAGEPGAIGAPPALVNAIVDAIQSHTGFMHVGMPVTAASLWAVIEPTRGKKAA